MNWALKPLVLPSSGLFYKSIINIKEPDIFLLNEIQKNFIESSESEFLYFIISRYTDFKRPEMMKYNDAFFVWMYLYSLMNNGDPIQIDSECTKCNSKNKIKIDLSSIKINFLNSLSPKKLSLNFLGYDFLYNYRTIEHNLITGTREIQNENKNDPIEMICSYFENQCISITKENEVFSGSSLREIVSYFGYKNSITFLNKIKDEDWGIPHLYQYKCSRCYNINKTTLGDSLVSSLHKESEIKRDVNIEEIIWVCGTKILSLEEVLSIPISQWESINKTIIKIEKSKHGIKNYLDNLTGE
jgi:hypothetical protein